MVKALVNLSSYVFHPLFISLYGGMMYCWFQLGIRSNQELFLVLIQITILTVLVPLALFFLLLQLGKINSFQLADVEQRRIPLFIQAVVLFLLATRSITFEFMPELHLFYWGGIVSAAVAFVLVLFYIKASLHMMGITALTVFAMSLAQYYQMDLTYTVAFLVLSCGMVGTSRLLMKAHTNQELIWGVLVGGIPQLIAQLFWNYYSI